MSQYTKRLSDDGGRMFQGQTTTTAIVGSDDKGKHIGGSKSAKVEEFIEHSFNLTYLGYTPLDRRYTQQILFWVVVETKRKRIRQEVVLTVTKSSLKGLDIETEKLTFEHQISGITRFARNKDQTSFAYITSSPAENLPCYCHVFEASDLTNIPHLLECLQDAAMRANTAVTVDDSKDVDRHSKGKSSNIMFRLRYVGKVAISHRQIPPQLLDETIEKFRKHWLENYQNKARRRTHSTRETTSSRSHSGSAINLSSDTGNEARSNIVRHGSVPSLRRNRDENTENYNKWTDEHNNEREEQEKVLESLRPPLIKSVDSLPPSGGDEIIINKVIVEKSNPDSEDNEEITATAAIDLSDKLNLNVGDGKQVKPFYEANRSMVLNLKNSSVTLNNCESGRKMLERRMKDISYCCKGEKEDNYFAFVCREAVTGNYQLYVFECETSSMTSSIMDAFKQGFQALLQMPSNLFCETCPLNYFHRLCLQLEGLSGYLALVTVEKFISTLDDDDRAEVHTKFKELVPHKSSIQDDQDRVELSMIAVRAILECKQAGHTHYSNSTSVTTNEAKNLNAMMPENVTTKEAPKLGTFKSLAASFENLIRGRSKSKVEEPSTPAKGLEVNQEKFRHRSYTVDTPSRPTREKGIKNSMDDIMTTPSRSSVASSSDGSKPTSPTILSASSESSFVGHLKDSNTTKNKSVFSKQNLPRRLSWRQALFKRVQLNTPITGTIDAKDGEIPSINVDEGSRKPRSSSELRLLWRKAIKRQIEIIRNQKDTNSSGDSCEADEKLDYVQVPICGQNIYQQWDDIMAKESDGPLPYETLAKALQAGVPKSKRGQIWNFLRRQHYARDKKQSICLDNKESSLAELLEKEATNHQHAITLDLGRTFPTHKYFISHVGDGQVALRNVLKAYALLDPEVGYCQGLSFVAAILIMHMDDDDAFECFKYILCELHLRDQYKPDMAALHIQMYNLSRLIYDNERDIYELLEQNEIGPSLYAAPWFLTLFASQFPLGFVVRVLDLLFLDGIEAIYKMSLMLIKHYSRDILAAGSFESIIDVLKQDLPSVVLDHLDDLLNGMISIDIANQLRSFEIEYHVLHEEMLSAPQLIPSDSVDSRISQLESLNQHLKRQNIELVDKLANSRSKVNELEETIELTKKNHEKLLSRIQELQKERDSALQQLIMQRKSSTDSFDDSCRGSTSSEESNQDSLLELCPKTSSVHIGIDNEAIVDDRLE